jgi:hypothetical protein
MERVSVVEVVEPALPLDPQPLAPLAREVDARVDDVLVVVDVELA